MGWRGALRSMAAAQRAAERESIRRQKHLARLSKEHAKLDTLRHGELEVEAYENWIDRITSIHHECGLRWEWEKLANSPSPEEPSRVTERESKAASRLQTYNPGFFDRLFRRVEAKRAALAREVKAARATDQQAHAVLLAEFEAKRSDWKDMRDLAHRILGGDLSSYEEAVAELSPLVELSDLGSRLKVEYRRPTGAEVTFQVNSDTVIPSETKSLLQSGKLSVKKMPQSRFLELYQDYVCGAMFRIARELVAVLPLETVVVTACSHMLDTSSGHLRDQAILSVILPRKTLDNLQFQSLDPSDALRHFVYRMEFKKTKGFSPIVPLRLEDVVPDQ